MRRVQKRLAALCILCALLLSALYIRITPTLWGPVQQMLSERLGSLTGFILGRTVQSVLDGGRELRITIQGIRQDGPVPSPGRITGAEAAIDPQTHPYFSFLSKKEQIVYKQVYAAALSAADSFALEAELEHQQLHRVIEAVYYDCPGLFWLDTGYSYSCRTDGICTAVTLQYLFSGDALTQARAAFEQAAAAVVEGAKLFDTDFERERYVHNVLVAFASYDENAIMSQSAYSALILGKTVCAGYARAFQYVMNRLGITTYYCVGTSGGDHAWNLVCLEDGWYNVDLTWDDVSGAELGFFNGTDADFSRTHARTGDSLALPRCTATTYRVFNAQPGGSLPWNSFGYARPDA